jgi:hypothetical protein
MKKAQVWLLLSCIAVGGVFGLARGAMEKEAFLNQPVREPCKFERCTNETSTPKSQLKLHK